MNDRARCRRCPEPATRGPYCEHCANEMITNSMTSPSAAPPQAEPWRRRPRSGAKNGPPRPPGQASLFDNAR